MRYATFADAEADGWQRVNRATDRDISGIGYYGYDFESPNGQQSQTIHFTEERNKLGRKGAWAPMIRTEDCGHRCSK